jgi:3-carboxy-cis,cis-muconate cycloisomerase
MSDLFWPGEERAGDTMSPVSFLAAMVRVEEAWLSTLVASGVAPYAAKADLTGLVGPDDIPSLARASESGGNPAIPLASLLRKRIRASNAEAARWLHRGLTSQDVVDSALMVCSRDLIDRVTVEVGHQVEALVDLADRHRSTVMVGRTLTQHAVPITFGLKASGWLAGVLDAADALLAARSALAVQAGGAAGTSAATVELARSAGLEDPVSIAMGQTDRLAAALGLARRASWHTSRGPVTGASDALVTATDAWGQVASDVATLARPEIGELSEPADSGRGGSSTMPQKHNPVLSVLIRRAAIAAPPLAATLHTAAALAVDERPDGAWHVEWSTLATLGRRTLVAASQTAELLGGLQVDTRRMARTVAASREALLAEQGFISGSVRAPSDYLGTSELVVDATLARARRFMEGGR